MDEKEKLQLKAQIGLATSIEEANRILEDTTGLKTASEKTCFLKGMCNLEDVDIDELVYKDYLSQVMSKFEKL